MTDQSDAGRLGIFYSSIAAGSTPKDPSCTARGAALCPPARKGVVKGRVYFSSHDGPSGHSTRDEGHCSFLQFKYQTFRKSPPSPKSAQLAYTTTASERSYPFLEGEQRARNAGLPLAPGEG
eukprot:564130-Pyramimonas_sp.AAC.1